jgi:hypothetical protein
MIGKCIRYSLILLIAAGTAGCGRTPEKPVLLERMQKEVHAVFTAVESDLKQVIDALTAVEFTSDESRSRLVKLIEKFGYVEGVAIVGLDGRIVTFEPEKNHAYEGHDISFQDHMKQFAAHKRPVLSNILPLIEGGYGAVIVRPLYGADKNLRGSINVVVRPHRFLDTVFKPILENFPVGACMMDTNGVIVYDRDFDEIGANVFSDPRYESFESLKSFARQMQTEKDGVGIYEYFEDGTNKPVTKHMYWTTVQMYGTQWRVILMQQMAQNINIVRKTIGRRAPASLTDAVQCEAEDEKFFAAAAAADTAALTARLEQLYNSASMYYAAWIDTAGTCRAAYPRENSLYNYDFHQNRTAHDRLFLNVVENRTQSTFTIDLPEGGKADVVAFPVFKGEEFAGVVYGVKKRLD